MSKALPNNTISRSEVDTLDSMINSEIVSTCVLDWNAINDWKGQFI